MNEQRSTRKKSRGRMGAGAAAVAAVAMLGTSVLAQVGPDPGPVPTCDAHPPVTPCDVVVDKELFITDLCVVNDHCRTTWDGSCPTSSRGAWTFGKLMAGLAGFSTYDSSNAQAVSDFVLNWLQQIENDTFVQYDSTVIPGVLVDGRPWITDVIKEWAKLSGSCYDPDAEGCDTFLDMRVAPFRLLAIVNRIDLRTVTGGYANGTAGEGRFVFCFLRPDPDAPMEEWQEIEATVIFEYNLLGKGCDDIVKWAKAWHKLGSIPFGPTFNKTLQEITDAFAGAGLDPTAPNGSGISQVRTNEFQNSPWELREFHLSGPQVNGIVQLQLESPALSVHEDRNNTPELADYLTVNEPQILAGSHVVPDTWTFGGTVFPFAAGSSLAFFTWNAPGFDDCTDTRHLFALNNCNGCHLAETATGFYHVFPRPINEESNLSRFLTGVPPFPSGGAHAVQFNCNGQPFDRKFWDFMRRAKDLCDVLSNGCDADDVAFIIAPASDGKDAQLVQVEGIFATPNVAETVH